MTDWLFDGMGGHQGARSTTDEWLTPPALFLAMGVDFDLDPCAACTQTHIDGKVMGIGKARYCKCDDGFNKEWKGCVWLNPPYGKETGRWLAKLAKHGNGIALIFARTDVGYFHDSVFKTATGLFFIMGRLVFNRPDGTTPKFNGGAPSVLVSYGDGAAVVLENLHRRLDGYFVRLRGPKMYRPLRTVFKRRNCKARVR